MASLTNNKIKDTYQSLVKFNDNGNITTSAKRLTDGFGNNSPFFVSTTQIGIGVTPTLGYDLHVNSNTKIGGNLEVGGNLTVSGTLTYLNVEDLATEDPLIKLARNNDANLLDIGFFGKYVESTVTKYKGLFNDADDDKWKLFIGTSDEPTTVVDTGGTGYTVGTLVANLEGNVTGTVSSLSNHDTDDLSEGTTNLYFTTARARASFTEGTGVTITDGEIAIGQAVATTSNVTFGNITGSAISGTTGTFSSIGQFAGAIRITETATAQRILIGNQDSGGVNKPAIIQGANANLYFGYGDSWTGEGGNMTNILVISSADSSSTFSGNILPNADSTYNIGANNNKWAEGHFDHLYIGETGNNPRIDIYTEDETAAIADTFADTTTDKSYIYFNAGTSSNDPAYIMHETSNSETNEGVLHLVPSDDNNSTDYVSIHGTNDPDSLKLHTSGLISTANGIGLELTSDSGTITLNDSISGTTGTFSGQVTIPETPTADAHAASKKYVDDNIVPAQSLSNVLGVGNTSGANDIIMEDSQKVNFGDDSDLFIVHSGTNGVIENSTGELFIQNTSDGKDIVFKSDNGSGDIIEYFRLDGSTSTIPFGRSPHIVDNLKLYFGNDTANDASIKWDSTASELFIDGESKFLDNLAVVGAIKDSSGDSGTSGQVLSSTGSGTNWVDVEADVAKRIDVTVKNVSGGSLAKGTVVHAAPTADPPEGNVIEVDKADANDATKMPAIGVLNETIADEAEGEAVMFGAVSGIDTSSFSIGDELYVSTTAGEFTATKPTANDELVQKVAIVIKSDASNGLIKVFGAGRANDVPNQIDRDVNFTDNSKLTFGDSTTPDYKIFHNGSASFINNYTGDLNIANYADDQNIRFYNDDGSGGVVEYFRIDGSVQRIFVSKLMRFADDVQLRLGDNNDIRLYHNSTDSENHIENHTGSLYITNYADDEDIIFRNDNGSGDVIEYFRLDGSTNTVAFGRSLHITDNVRLYFGNDTVNDANMRWDSTANQLFIDGAVKFLDGLSIVGDLSVTGNFKNDLIFERASTRKIIFNSDVNFASDLAFLYFNENSSFHRTGTENVRFSIGAFNDFSNSTAHSDAVDLQGGARLYLNVGDWDTELDSAIGTPAVGAYLDDYPIQFAVNNDVKVKINDSGHLYVDSGEIVVTPSTGYGRIEVGGASGGYIDLKAPASDDYDMRFITGQGGNEITTASADLKINTDNTLALTIDTSQNANFSSLVGIGVSPTAKLHIQGTNSANGAIKIQNSGGNPYAIYSDNNDLLFTNGNGSSTALTIAYSGDATFAGSVTADSFIKDGGTSSQYLMADGSVSTTAGVDGSGTANDVAMWSDSDTLTDAPIAISGNDAVFAGEIKQSTRTTLHDNGTITWGSSNNFGELSWDGNDDYALYRGKSGKGIKLQTNGSTTALTLDTSQNATFAGTIDSDNITVGKSDGNNSSISLTANTGNWTFTNVQASRNLEISDSDGTGTVMTIDTSGKVGISTTSPSNKLHTVAASAITDESILRLSGGSTGFNGANDADIEHSIIFDACAYKATTGVVQREAAKIAIEKDGSWNEADIGTGTRASLVFSTNNGTIDSPDLAERMRIDSSGGVEIYRAGNTNGGTLLIGPHGSGSNKWSYLAGTHYNQDTGSGNGSGSAGVAIIGAFSDSSSNIVYIGGGPYEINAANAIIFATHTSNTSTLGGSEKMRIDSSGRVGINVTNSTNALEVRAISDGTHAGIFTPNFLNSGLGACATTLLVQSQKAVALNLNRYYSFGTIQEFRQNNDLIGNFDVTSSKLTLATAGARNLTFTTNGSERMNVDGSGVVSVATGNLRLDGTAKLYTNNDDLTISSDDNGNGSDGKIIFKTVNNERIRINNAGTLKFNNDILTRKIVLYEGYDNDYQFYGFGINAGTLVYSVFDVGDSHVFYTGTSASARTELMRIKGNGRVGINVTNPSARFNTHLAVSGTLLAYQTGTSATFDASQNIAVVHDSSAMGTNVGAGLLLANNNNSNNAISPLIAFSAKSASNSYNHTYAAIYGQKRATGADTNWNKGDLILATSSGTGVNEVMRITKDSRVGINNTDPQATFEIGGASATLRVGPRYSSGGDRDFVDLIAAGTDSKILSNNERFHIENNSGDIIINPSNNVGVDDTTPLAKFEVAGSIKSTNRDVGHTGEAGVTLSYSSADNMSYLETWQSKPLTTRTYANQHFNISGSEKMIITSSGVGIGTSPETTLHVKGQHYFQFDTVSGEGTKFENHTSGGHIKIGWQQNDTDGMHHRAYLIVKKDSNGTYGGRMDFQIRNHGTAADLTALTIRSNKYVGINKENPSYNLHVGGSAEIDGTLYTDRVAAGIPMPSHIVDAYSSTSGVFAGRFVYAGTSGSDCAMLLRLAGGSTAPSYVDFIYGSVQTGYITTNGSATFYGSASDYRLKENVVELNGALDRLDNLQPKRFNFTSTPEQTVDGFLAHEVADVVPEAIHGEKDAVNEYGEIKAQGIDQSKLVPLLVAAVQELRAEVKYLKNEINKLK